MKKVYAVEGMSCSGCANSVQTKLGQVNGVTDAKVSLEDKKATLAGDYQVVDLVAALADTSYTIEV